MKFSNSAVASFAIAGALVVTTVFASTTNGTIDTTNRYAWSENAGWIDFGTTAGNVHITDSALTGYAWGENIGWISLNCSNDSSCATVDYKVTNTNAGVLGGNAWSENVGWIQFAPTNGGVTINSSGIFSGYAWGENVGWIVFNCSSQSSCATVDYKVSTDWRPASERVTATATITPVVSQPSGGGGFGSRSPRPPINPMTRQIAPVSTSPSTLASPSQSSPAVLLLTQIRERLLQRIEKRLENVTSVSTKKILEGIRERLLKRIDARIRSVSGNGQ